MSTQTWTKILIFTVTIFVIVYDAFMVFNSTPGDTITEVMRSSAKEHPIIGVAVGILVGHLFF